MLKITAIKKIDTGADVPFEFEVPDQCRELTFLHWCNHSVEFIKTEEWFRDYYSSPTAEKMSELVSSWDKSRQAEFKVKTCEMIGLILGKPLSEILDIPNVHELGDMSGLYMHLLLIPAKYKPKIREEFMVNGNKYVLPRNTIMALDNIDYAVNLTSIEACHALYIEQMYGKTDDEGRFTLPNAKYEMDLRIIAAISRKIVREADGKSPREIEMPPTEINRWGDLQNRKFKEFEQMPLDVALDLRFFLTKLKPNSKIIHLFQSHLKAQLKILKKQAETGPTKRISSRPGGGISPFLKSLISITSPGLSAGKWGRQ